MTTESKTLSNSQWTWAVVVLLLGITLRMLLPFRGYNYDIESWKIAADIMAHGGNVYGETGRYNYGPIWFYILHGLNQYIGSGFGELIAFRWKVAAFLTGVDVAIFLLLLRIYGVGVASLFFLNPISIIITGYHSQLDGLAVLLGLLAAWVLQRYQTRAGWWCGLGILGLSLSTKHILFFFPIWVALKQEHWRNKLLAVLVPYGIFLVLFVPFWHGGSEGITNNVFLYRSFNNAPFWHVFTPQFLYTVVPPVILFFMTLFFLGLYWRTKAVLESMNLYLIAVVVFSSAVANQYLTIATPAIATQWNWGYGAFTAFTTLYLLVDWAGLHLGLLQRTLHWQGQYGYFIAITFLFFGLLIHTLGKEHLSRVQKLFRDSLAWLKQEIAKQLKAPW